MIGALLIQMEIMAGLAWEESCSDFFDIADNQPINHSAGFKRRAGIALITAAMISLFVATGMDELDWSLLKIFGGLCLVSYGFFTPLFRLNLNRLRKLDLRYISPSSVYDWLFIGADLCFQFKFHWAFHKRRAAMFVHGAYFKPNNLVRQEYVQHIHRAGTWAYAVEGLALLIGSRILLNQP